MTTKDKGGYFEGWYFKHRAAGRTLALIPGMHRDAEGRLAAFLQVAADGFAFPIPYDFSLYHTRRGRLGIALGNNLFGERGVRLDVDTPGLRLKGVIRYGPLTPLKGDIMGPFALAPGMECRHGVISMGHPLAGRVECNGEIWDFTGGTGYIETDRGRSFPRRYLWTQCNEFARRGDGVMASAAVIPYGGLQFPGCIAAVIVGGREYRLATYTGARIRRWNENGLVLQRGDRRLTVEAAPGAVRSGQSLLAPRGGAMDRRIREAPACPVHYLFEAGGRILLDETSAGASFEYDGA